MNRRETDHMSSEDIHSQRIVRRKLHRSLSPDEIEGHSTKRPREMREEQGEVYDKYRSRERHEDYPVERSSKDTGVRPENKGSKSSGGYNSSHRTNYSSVHYRDKDGGNGRSSRDNHISSSRRESSHMSSPSNHISRPPPPPPPSSDSFDYSLRVGNIDYSLTDNQVRSSLFSEFKKFGYVNIKVIGFGKERHAYVNFNRADDAKAACNGSYTLNGRDLDVNWSRSTLNRFPDLLTRKFNEPRSSKKRHVEDYESYHGNISSSSDREPHQSSRTGVRDISYRNGSSSSRDRRTHTSLSDKPATPVIDPNATRTLFVGNLEIDITERELRDIFSPYGRIESVDIKTTRTSTAAYSFVKFVTINDAIVAKNELHGRLYGNFRLSIGFGKGTPAAKVWVGNITCYADVSEIRKELDRFGLIRRVDYVNDDNHCFVHFDGMDSAEAAVASLKNYRFKRTNKPLRIDMMQHRDNINHGGNFDNPNPPPFEVKSYEARHGLKSNDRRSRAAEFQKESGLRDKYRSRDRREGRVLSEGGTNSPQYTTEKFRHSYNASRKRERSPQSYSEKKESEHNGDSRPKRSRNGFDAYEYHNLYKHTDKPPSRSRSRPRSADKEREPSDHRERDEPEHKSPPKDTLTQNQKNGDRDETKSVQSTGSDIPPPPPTIPTETYDTALNLNASEVTMEETKVSKADSAETLGDLAKMYPMAWRGNLVLKNTGFPTRMHLIGGDPAVVEMLVRCRDGKEDTSSLRITQRLRLEPPRLDEVNKRMASAGPSGHCILIALPGPTPSQSSSPDHHGNGLDAPIFPNMQLRPLRSLVSYLKQKEAAGIVALNTGGDVGDISEIANKDNIGVLHAFPPCEFSHGQLLKVAPNLGPEPAKEDHIVVLLVKGTV